MAFLRLSAIGLILALVNASGFAQQPASSPSNNRANAAFATGESFIDVYFNAYFGYKEANAEAFKKLEANAALLNEPGFQQKIHASEQVCVTKGCKDTVPPFSHVAKEWKKVQKHMTAEEANYAVMGVAVGTVEFYYRYAPKLIPAVRVQMISASATATNQAQKACAATQGCPESVRGAFDELNTRLIHDKDTAARAAELVNVISDNVR